MDVCGKFAIDILQNCQKPIVGGVKDRLILINMSDIESIIRNNTNPQIIEDIILVSSPQAKAYYVEGKNGSNDLRSALVKQTYTEMFTHECIFRIFDNSPDIKQNIENMARGGRMVAVVENNFRGTGDVSSFEIFGIDIGLELVECESNKSDQETQGAWVLTLRSPERNPEPHLPATLFDTDYATTKAIVTALIS
jgi:hypothetical protein